MKFFLSYATANEHLFGLKDSLNILRRAIFEPGVTEVFFYVAISQLNPKIKLVHIELKSNIGRDFYFAAVNLRSFSQSQQLRTNWTWLVRQAMLKSLDWIRCHHELVFKLFNFLPFSHRIH